MNRVFVCMLLVGVVAMINASYLSNVDTTKIVATLKNPDAVKAYRDCIIATPEIAKVKCDKVGTGLREKIPEAIKAGGCPATCDANDKSWVAYMLKKFKEDYAPLYESITAHYKPTAEQTEKVNAFIASTPLPAGV